MNDQSPQHAEAKAQLSTGKVTLAWFADHYARPYSEVAVETRIGDHDGLNDPATLIRALEAIGLTAARQRKRLSRIDPIVLPCVIFDKQGGSLVLTAFDAKRDWATWRDPRANMAERRGPLKDLQKQVGPEIVLVTPEDASDHEMVKARHWFWGPIRAHWPAWGQILLASLLVNVMGLALPLFIMNVYDKVVPNLSFVTLWTLAIGVSLAVGADLLLRLIRSATVETAAQRIDLKVGAEVYRHALDLGLLKRPGGAAGIAGRIREYETVRDFLSSSTFVAFFDMIFIVIFLAVLYVIVGPLVWLPAAAVPLVLLLALLCRAAINTTSQNALELANRRQTVLIESLRGTETVKTLNAEGVMQREWENAIAATARVSGKARFWSNLSVNGTMLIQQAVSVGIIVWGVFLIFDGRISIGALIAASILSGRAMAPLGAISQATFRLQYARRALASLNEMMGIQGDKPRTVRSHLKIRAGDLNLTGVTFTYPGAQVPALQDLDLQIAPGECVALLGRVGSGKTTLGKLLSGLIEPDQGNIRIDGFGLNQYDRSELRAGIGYLPQTNELFTGTLRENLLLAKPAATQSEIEAALYFSGLGDFVAASPEGLEMPITENGVRLSGGQAQALALARVLLKDAKVLFLDEPTNAMDQEMEQVVCTRLKELSAKGVTLILCTHRQSLAAIADRYVVLERGRKVIDDARAAVMARMAPVKEG